MFTPDWQLPRGTDRGLWDYMSSERLAREYDTALEGSPLLAVDVRFVEKHFPTPGTLIDLGCGTGRLLIQFAARGYTCTGVDLSEVMLQIVREKAESRGLSIERIQANLVELDSIAAGQFDYAACLFSTLGMIRGQANRRQFLTHVKRILKPGGRFVVHTHNAQFHLGFGQGRRGSEPGDRTMPQHRGGAELTLHHFRQTEILRELQSTGFRINEIEYVSTSSNGQLTRPWFFPRQRAHGFLISASS